MEKTNTTLDVNAYVECPYCEESFDLFYMDTLTDDGYIYNELMPRDEIWGKDNWGEIVGCPGCGEKMIIGSVEW